MIDDNGAELELVYQRKAEREWAKSHAARPIISKRGRNRHFARAVILEIRSAPRTPQDVHRLMAKYQISTTTVYEIRNRRTYRDVT